MNRAVLLLVPLVLAGCKRDEAVQALIHVDPKQLANCVVLQVLSPKGEMLAESEPLPRPDQDREISVAVFRQKLPADVQLRARAFWGTTKCGEPRFYNGGSDFAPVHFTKESQDVRLAVSQPGDTEDKDRDGYVSAELGGADCDDRQEQRRPGVQEMCDASDDLNCDDRRGCDDATCSNKTCSRAAVQLAFSPSVLKTKAGDCTLVLVERRDSTGANANVTFATPITMSSTMATGVTFHADADCKSSAPPPAIPANNSGVAVYVRSTLVGEASLTATAPLLQPASLAHTLLPGAAKKLTFTSPSRDSQAGDCSPVSLELRDAFNNFSPDTLASITLSPAPTNPEEGFYTDAACTAPFVPTALPAAASVSFYFKGIRAPTSTIEARSGTTALVNQEARTVRALAASMMSLSNAAPQTFLAGQCSPAMNVRITDKYGNLSPLAAGQTITLSTTPEIGLEVFWGQGCKNPLETKILDPRGVAENSLSFRGKTGGTVDVKLSGAQVGEVSQSQLIVPVVRRGSCRLESGESTKSCSIGGPAKVNPSQAFLVFQSTSDNDAANSSFVRCSLTATTVECNRNASSGHAAIEWQVVELYQGLSVQHLPDSGCTLGNTSQTYSISVVPESSAFVLFSSSQNEEPVDKNDFASVRLSGPNAITASVKAGCTLFHKFAFQVVQLGGSSVQRAVTGALSKGSLIVSGLQSTDLTRAIVTTSWQVSSTGQDIYKRVVRGEIDPTDATRLRFFRGAETPFTADSDDIPQISWERITFPQNTLVQTQTLTLADTELRKTYTLPTPVDSTRTLLLTSSQLSGQGGGETAYATNDILGVATARLSLTNGNQLTVERDSRYGAASWTVYAVQFDPYTIPALTR
jgi:hypothetical protein